MRLFSTGIWMKESQRPTWKRLFHKMVRWNSSENEVERQTTTTNPALSLTIIIIKIDSWKFFRVSIRAAVLTRQGCVPRFISPVYGCLSSCYGHGTESPGLLSVQKGPWWRGGPTMWEKKDAWFQARESERVGGCLLTLALTHKFIFLPTFSIRGHLIVWEYKQLLCSEHSM